jgi:ABC-type lipoprotein release transport system permease subunit
VIGTGLAWAGRAAISLLYGSIVLSAAVALIASYGPARQASRLEPMNALREE